MPALSVVFVLKTVKGVPERIGCGVLEGSEEELTTIFARSDNAAAVPPLLIDGYTRELPPLQTLTPLHLKAAEGDQGLSKYAAYLQQRNKSAVIKLAGNNKGRLLFLSPDPKSKHLLLCYLHTPTARPAVGPPILPPLSLEARVEAALSVFATDPDFNGPLSFEPMDKVQRFIVHDAVEQWSQQTSVAIVSESMGDDDERHVEVYRKGFEPKPEPTVAENFRVLIATQTTKKNQVSKRPPISFEALKKVNQVRDRRTVEEVQLERQIKRQKCKDEEEC